MKRLLLFVFILSSGIAFGQKTKPYFIDKTDPFTKERTIFYGNTYINEFAMAGIHIKLKGGDVETNTLVFTIPYIESTTEGGDSVTKECKLKLNNNNIVTGKWKGTNTADILGKKYTSFSYEFSNEDFRSLQSINITAVKMNEYTYELSSKNQNKIGGLIKAVYSKL